MFTITPLPSSSIYLIRLVCYITCTFLLSSPVCLMIVKILKFSLRITVVFASIFFKYSSLLTCLVHGNLRIILKKKIIRLPQILSSSMGKFSGIYFLIRSILPSSMALFSLFRGKIPGFFIICLTE